MFMDLKYEKRKDKTKTKTNELRWFFGTRHGSVEYDCDKVVANAR